MLVAVSGRWSWVRRPTIVKIRRNRSHGESNALRFSEQGDQDDSCKNGALYGDGNRQSPTANTPLTRALLAAAFHKTSLKRTKIFLRTGTGIGFDRHHTPPLENSARKNRNYCDAGFPWVAQLPRETGAALAGM